MTVEPLAGAPVTATIRLQFLDFRVDVETNSLSVARRLQAYFGSYLTGKGRAQAALLRVIDGTPTYEASRMQVWERPASGREPKESYYDRGGVRYILKNRTGLLITLSEEHAEVAGDVVRNVNQVINVVNTLFGLSLLDRGYAMLHASAVAARSSDEGIVFMGNSGSGKSSLALQLIERGDYDFVSNDRVLLKVRRNRVHLVGLPKKPRVNPGTLLASQSLSRLLPARKRPSYEKLSPVELWALEDKTDVDVRRALGAHERLDATLARAYCLQWRPSGEGLLVEQLDPDRALAEMLVTAKDFGPFDVKRDSRDMLREYRRLAAAGDFARVSGKADPSGFAKRLTAGRI